MENKELTQAKRFILSGIQKKKKMDTYKRFYYNHVGDECYVCGMGHGEVALFEVHQIMDSKMVFDGIQITLCHDCLSGKDFIEFWSDINSNAHEEEWKRLREKAKKELNTERNLDEHDLTFIPDFKLINIVCSKCGETLPLEIESEFSKIPFEGTWTCKCSNYIKMKWDGKELKYL